MKKVGIIYYGGKLSAIRRMAIKIAEGARGEGVEAVLKGVEDIQIEELPAFDALILGCPSYFGGIPGELKKFLDDTLNIQGKLDGKVGAVFSSSQYLGGGNETTIIALLTAFLFHGMIVQGDPQGYHFGPITLNPTGMEEDVLEADESQCRRLGQRVAQLIKRLA